MMTTWNSLNGAKKFRDLRSKMSPESQERAHARTEAMLSVMGQDGYRYVRSYRAGPRDEWRWALWERQHGKMRRVGTAHTEQDYRRFLGLDTLQGEAGQHGHDVQE